MNKTNELIKYDDNTHTYTLGDKVLTSVTQIASEICGIKPQFFKAGAAAKGTDIHTELGRYYDPSDKFSANDFTIDEAAKMALFLKAEPDMRTEVIVWNEALSYAGTCDLVRAVGNKISDIVDFKSGSVNKKYCTVQLSLYRLALEAMGYDVSDCRLRVISPKGVTIIDAKTWKQCWDLQKSELEPIDKDELDAIEDRMKELAPLVEEYKQLEEQLRTSLLEQLELSGATQYTGRMFVATYVQPTTRVSLDSKRLKEEHPDIYESYAKETQVKGTIKLTNVKD
jgi:hypothetical protein